MNDDQDSDHMPLNPSRMKAVSEFDFVRLEQKVDRMAEALQTLIRVEERQMNQGQRLGDLETQSAVNSTRIDAVTADLAKWVNRGIGIWMLALTFWSAVRFFLNK
jgi:3-oxoacyl-(acyl-carrier-protein) synthase